MWLGRPRTPHLPGAAAGDPAADPSACVARTLLIRCLPRLQQESRTGHVNHAVWVVAVVPTSCPLLV